MPALEITNTNDMWLDKSLLLSVLRNIDPTSIQHLMIRLKVPQLDGTPTSCHADDFHTLCNSKQLQAPGAAQRLDFGLR